MTFLYLCPALLGLGSALKRYRFFIKSLAFLEAVPSPPSPLYRHVVLRILFGAIILSGQIFAASDVHAKPRPAKAFTVPVIDSIPKPFRFTHETGEISCSNTEVVVAAGSIASFSGSGNTITLEKGGVFRQGDTIRIIPGAGAKLTNAEATNTFNIKGYTYLVKGKAEAVATHEYDLEITYFKGTDMQKTEQVLFAPDGSYDVRVKYSTGEAGRVEYNAESKSMKVSGKADVPVSNTRILVARGAHVTISGSKNIVSFEAILSNPSFRVPARREGTNISDRP
jgi:hypothetical protein